MSKYIYFDYMIRADLSIKTYDAFCYEHKAYRQNFLYNTIISKRLKDMYILKQNYHSNRQKMRKYQHRMEKSGKSSKKTPCLVVLASKIGIFREKCSICNLKMDLRHYKCPECKADKICSKCIVKISRKRKRCMYCWMEKNINYKKFM